MLIALFDKSFLHSLTVDEAALFDVQFMSNITPLFFVETLADLTKQVSDGRTPEQVVGNLANKTPQLHSYPNLYHHNVCAAELGGQSIDLRGVPAVGHGRPFQFKGKAGLSIRNPPEMEALKRWQDHQFLDVERTFAAEWRAMIQAMPRGVTALLGNDGAKLKLPDIAAARDLAVKLIDEGPPFVAWRAALEMVGLPFLARERATARWKAAGRPRLRTIAPYCAHVLTVELTFEIGASTGKVSAERPTNRIDLAYLHYLPFCQVFISGDRLHRTLAPLFLNDGQRFVWAHDLKADLAKLVTHYMGHPDIEREGLMRVAREPPLEGDYLITRLYDDLRPGWRERQLAPKPPRDPEADKKLLAELRAVQAAAARAPRTRAPGPATEDLDYVSLERHVPVRWGRWQFMPADIKPDVD